MQIKRVLPVLAGVVVGAPVIAQVLDTNVALRPDYRSEVHYTTYQRGGITEEIFTSQDAIAAARSGSPFPEGTVITMEDFRGGDLTRILVMEKRADWADRSASGSWLFAVYEPDGTLNPSETSDRCEACHASQADNDYVFTRDRMTN